MSILRTKPLVIGAPRSGFSLLISVLQSLINRSGLRPHRPYRQLILDRVVELAGFYATNRYRATFARFGITRNLVFNGEFQILVGGPKWLDANDPRRAASASISASAAWATFCSSRRTRARFSTSTTCCTRTPHPACRRGSRATPPM